MAKRLLQICSALFLIFYKNTWYSWLYLHMTAHFAMGSREYYWVKIFLEVIAIFLALLYLFIVEKGKIRFFKWKFRYFIELILAYGIDLISYRLWIPHLSGSSNSASINFIIQTTGQKELIYFLIMICFLAPIAEELLFRGVLMATFFYDSSWYGDVWLSTVFFAYVHVQSNLSPVHFLYYASGGLLFAILYRRTQSLLYPILLHILINTVLSWDLLLSLVSAG